MYDSRARGDALPLLYAALPLCVYDIRTRCFILRKYVQVGQKVFLVWRSIPPQSPSDMKCD